MKTLSTVAARPGPVGRPLPPVWKALDGAGIRPRRGQVTMIAGPPGSGKSLIALFWVTTLAERNGVKVLYVSADTDDWTTMVRAASKLTGHSMEAVESSMRSGGAGYYADKLSALRTVAWSFDTDPSFGDVAEEILAYNEMWGEYPHIVVLDNLMNVVVEDDNEWSGMKKVTRGVHYLARQTQAAVFILHHVNEVDDPRFPAPRKHIAGKVSQLPELILSLGLDPAIGCMRVATVKNRSGRADPTGSSYTELYVHPAKVGIYSSRYDAERDAA